jgi:ABC-type tungstate transport system substrate-binding protein
VSKLSEFANQAIKNDTAELTSAAALETSQAFVSLSVRPAMVYLAVTAAVDGRRQWIMVFAEEK